MRSLDYKNPVLHHLDGHKATGRRATVQQLPTIDGLAAEKSQVGLSTDPDPEWRESVPKGRQMWFAIGMVVVALAAFYGLVKYKVIKI